MTLASCMSLLAEINGVDDADNHRVHRAVFHTRRHSRGTAADDEDGFTDAGVDRVHGDEIAALESGAIAGVDRSCEQQLVADQTRILPRRDDGAHDSCEN